MRMRVWLVLGLSVAAVLALAPRLAAQAKRPDPKWALSWEAAQAEAKERNVPIFYAQHQDG